MLFGGEVVVWMGKAVSDQETGSSSIAERIRDWAQEEYLYVCIARTKLHVSSIRYPCEMQLLDSS